MTEKTTYTATRLYKGIPVSWATRPTIAEALMASGIFANHGSDSVEVVAGEVPLPREDVRDAVHTLAVAAWHAAKDAGLDPEVVELLDRAVLKLDEPE